MSPRYTPDMTVRKGVLQPVAARIVLKFLYSARFYRYDILFAVNWLARMVTRWTVECDARLAQLAAYVKTTAHYVGESTIGDNPADCRIGLFVDANYAGDVKDSKSTSGGMIVLFGPRTFAPITAICKRQAFVSHSSTESEIIALEHGLRTEGLPMLSLWDVVLHIFAPASEAMKIPPSTGAKAPFSEVTKVPPVDVACVSRARNPRRIVYLIIELL